MGNKYGHDAFGMPGLIPDPAQHRRGHEIQDFMRRRGVLFGCCLAIVSVATAADRDYPFVAASLTTVPESSFEYPENTSQLKAKEFQLLLGLINFDVGKVDLDLGADYQYTRYEYTGIDGRNRDLHRLQLPVGMTYAMKKWRIDGFIAPGVSTSSNVMKDLFDKGNGDDLIVTARFEGTRPTGRNLHWLVGLAYDRAFGRSLAYPVFGVLYRPGESTQLRLIFPDPAIEYAATSRQHWSLRLFPAGHEWHVLSEELNDEFDYEVEAWRAQLTWSLDFRNRVRLDLSAGYEFGRHHEFIDDRGRTIDADAEDQFLFAVGLRFGDAPLPYTHAVAR
jgi:hypothetical protein